MEQGPNLQGTNANKQVDSLTERIKDYFMNLFWIKKKKKQIDKEEKERWEIDWGETQWWGMNQGESQWWMSWNMWKWKKRNNAWGEYETPIEDRDQYIPKDTEFWESEGEPSRFATVYPFYKGKYANGKLSYFSPSTNLWSKNRQLKPLNHSLENWANKYTYAWIIVAWVNAIPLPSWALPDTESLVVKWKSFPVFSIDQNWCVYLSSSEKMWISFDFWLRQIENTKNPIAEDSDEMIFSSLSKETRLLLEKLKLEWISIKSIKELEHYIKTQKKYSTKVQWTLRNKSNHKNYVKNLDASNILECYSANTLFVALCRYLWFSARLVTGFAVDRSSKKWEWLLSSNNGHAWSEVWDETQWKWIEFDATPIKKEDWEDSNQNRWDDNNENNESQEQWGENSEWENENSWEKWDSSKEESWKKSKEKSDNSDSDWESESSSDESESDSSDSQPSNNRNNDSNSQFQQQKTQKQQSQKSNKSPSELLDEMLDLAKKEDLEKYKDELEETQKKLDEAKSKEEIRDILDKSDLWEFSKEIADEKWNKKILEEEKKELENIDDENELDKALNNSLLDDEYKRKLEEYVNELRRKIQEQKKRMQKEMERLWFSGDELRYYKEYKELEKEVEPEVKRQIKELQKILPANYQYKDDETQRYRSWYELDSPKLVEYYITWNQNIFIRQEEVRESNEINMFETILIDTSWSMGHFWNSHSILRESIKAAITRAKVLEHFKVDFSIILFWDTIREVMSFWEKFSSKWRCLIPSKLMRAAYESWWNSQEPISYVYDTMIKMMKKKRWRSFGNISFIGDWDLYQFQELPELKAKIDDLKKRGFWVTAYYINEDRTPLLWYYFWEKDWEEVVYARWCKDLSKSIIESHRNHLRFKIKKYMK